MSKRCAGLIILAVACLLTAAPALARGISQKVVPFTSVAGVKFGWSPAHVRRVLGKPVKTMKAGDEPGSYVYNVAGGDQNLQIFFEPNSPHDGVSSFDLNGGHTIKGIHAASPRDALANNGSSRAAVRRVFGHYPHFHCFKGGYCTTTRGAAQVAQRYGAVEMQFNFLEGKLIGFSMDKNVIR